MLQHLYKAHNWQKSEKKMHFSREIYMVEAVLAVSLGVSFVLFKLYLRNYDFCESVNFWAIL